MKIENYIESQYRELSEKGLNTEYSELYNSVTNTKLQEIFETLHYYFIDLFKIMNQRLPTGMEEVHFWAEPSRELLNIIEITMELYDKLKNSEYSFEIDHYYLELIEKCKDFLSPRGGSELPANMEKIDLYYIIPIFKLTECIAVNKENTNFTYPLKQIGQGSYAFVYKYEDLYYNRNFVVKRAKKHLSDKEISRFKREYEEMAILSSPYILEVYRYFDEKNEYIMEYMDYTLESYITKNNSKLSIDLRKNIASQVLRAFKYIHAKGRLHRDISPKNILVKEYEDTPVVKISDFGLVKTPDSTLTTVDTTFKGCFNDPSLLVDGFGTYNILHETFALTRIVFFVLTGKTNTEKINNSKMKSFVEKGLNPDKTKRFQNVSEMMTALRDI